MCYSVSFLTHKNEVYARRLGFAENNKNILINQFDQIRNHIGTAWFRSGFEHPGLPIIVKLNTKPTITAGFWGLIPLWAKTLDQQKKIINQTLNARIETLDEKPSFKNAIQNKCLILIDGFFEYKHIGSKTQPFFIRHEDNRPMLFCGIYENSPESIPFPITVSIVTRPANTFMKDIHNKSQSGEARMPAILDMDSAELWLKEPFNQLKTLISILSIDDLYATPVRPLTGIQGTGNSPEAHIPLN